MRMMITIHFEMQQMKDALALVPKEQEHIKELREKGIVEALYISADRSVVWLVMKGESQAEIERELSGFPLYPYMQPQLVTLVD
jgi:muconolactone delta-isomerase